MTLEDLGYTPIQTPALNVQRQGSNIQTPSLNVQRQGSNM